MFDYSEYKEYKVDHALSNDLVKCGRTLPLTPPKGGSKNEFVIFVNSRLIE